MRISDWSSDVCSSDLLYTKNDSFNRGWWGLGAGVNWALGTRCNGLAEARYKQRQSDFGDLGIAVDNLEKTQQYAFSASCAGPAGIGLVGGEIGRASWRERQCQYV